MTQSRQARSARVHRVHGSVDERSERHRADVALGSGELDLGVGHACGIVVAAAVALCSDARDGVFDPSERDQPLGASVVGDDDDDRVVVGAVTVDDPIADL